MSAQFKGEQQRRRTARRDPLAPAGPDGEALEDLSGRLQLSGRHAEALALADAALASNPGSAAAWRARGDSLFNMDRSRDAAEAYRRAGRDPGTLVQLGRAYAASGALPEAFKAFEMAAKLDPASPLPRYQRGLVQLSLRNFAAGWPNYETRWRSERFLAASRGFVSPQMAPALTLAPARADLAGQRVLLVGEQGLGDQIMFASMIPDLAQLAAKVICVCQPRLIKLFEASFPEVTLLNPSGARAEADVLLAMGSLGCAFRTTIDSFPGAAYLRAPAPARMRWAQRLGPKSARLRVGLSWRGGSPTTRSAARSLPLAALAPVLSRTDCEFVSLQYGDVAAEVDAVNAARGSRIRYFPPEDLLDFADLAGLIENLDAVVSVDTATVHLTGALGITCFTLLPTDPEWRYGRSGEAMPWYSSVRLLRQTEPGAWADVLQQAAARIEGLAARM